MTTRRISSAAAGSAGSSSARPSSPTRRRDDLDLLSAVSGSGRTTVLKRRRSALDSSLTPRSRSLAVAITLKPRTACDLAAELGDRQRLLRQDRDQRVLHVGRDAGQLLDAGDLRRPAIARITGLGTSAVPRRALGQQPGVVPAVADRLLGGAGGALHEQRASRRRSPRRGARTPTSWPCPARRAAAARGRWRAWRRRSRSGGAVPTYFGVIAVPSAASPPSR